MPAPTTCSDLCELLVRSELVGPPTVAEYLARLAKTGQFPVSANEMASAAVRDGIITAFQARLVLQGKWKNFFLAGKYKVLEHLGAGGMGTVYLCEHRHMHRRVAVKIIPPDRQDPNRLARFRREAQAIAILDHPNIVRAFDIDQESGLNFLVMEYVDGASLQWLVDSRGPLAINRAVNYIAQAALGLQHAADMGLVHRDVKPTNLMLDWTGTIKLLDLGLARFSRNSDNLSCNGTATDPTGRTVMGTADYLAPEQAQTSDVDIRADVYSLGGVAHFLLTGKPPFDSGTVAQKLLRHQGEVPRMVNEIRPDVPAGLAGAVAIMLAKDPSHRPQSPGRVIASIREWLTDVPSPTPVEMPPTRFAPHRDVDTNAQHSTMSAIPKSTRSFLMKTMIAPSIS